MALRLGFQPVGAVDLDGYTYALAVLDMGPGSVDAWLAGLVAAELGLSLYERNRWQPLPYEGTLHELVAVMNTDLAAWAADWPSP